LSRRLIVNADDLGLSAGIDDGILRAAKKGIVRSVSLLAGGPTFDRAVRELEGTDLGVGVHLALSGGLRPVSPPREVGSLLEQGRFSRSWSTFLRRLMSRQVCLDEVERELEAQVRRVENAGVAIDHVDGHQHLHVFPLVLERVLRVCERHAIWAMRLPVERPAMEVSARELKRGVLSSLARGARRVMPGWMRTPDGFFGLRDGGRLDSGALRILIGELGDGIFELGCHPGARQESVSVDPSWRSAWTTELAALTDRGIQEALEAREVSLVRFSDL
jgi:predicted glycoside hydrolase/deacetylase ChbG (UPF0249 family)